MRTGRLKSAEASLTSIVGAERTARILRTVVEQVHGCTNAVDHARTIQPVRPMLIGSLATGSRPISTGDAHRSVATIGEVAAPGASATTSRARRVFRSLTVDAVIAEGADDESAEIVLDALRLRRFHRSLRYLLPVPFHHRRFLDRPIPSIADNRAVAIQEAGYNPRRLSVAVRNDPSRLGRERECGRPAGPPTHPGVVARGRTRSSLRHQSRLRRMSRSHSGAGLLPVRRRLRRSPARLLARHTDRTGWV